MEDQEKENNNLIEEIDITKPESYKGEQYKEALELYYKSENFIKLSPEQQQEIQEYFTYLIDKMNQPADKGKYKLPIKFYLDQIKTAIERFTRIKTKEESQGGYSYEEILGRSRSELSYIIAADNKVEKEVGELLWELYNREDISVGVHGTFKPEDLDISEEGCDFFKHGIMVGSEYKNGDARRTVNFQDLPGKQWSMGYVSFVRLLNYSYGTIDHTKQLDKPNANYTCIVLRPSSLKDTTYDETCPQEISLISPSTTIRTNEGKYISGHLIKPQFILGVFKNNKQFTRNGKCDIEAISKMNEQIQERKENQEQKRISERLIKETEEVPAQDKKNFMSKIKDAIKGIFKIKENDSIMR